MATQGLVGLFEQDRQNTLYRIAFPRLRRMAAGFLRGERLGHILQPTALVNESFLKLFRLRTPPVSDDHYLSLHARSMRQVLIDYARVPANRDVVIQSASWLSHLSDDVETSVTVREVFERLKRAHAIDAETVWLRHVEGFTIAEVAQHQNRKMWQVRAAEEFALDWMGSRLAIIRSTAR